MRTLKRSKCAVLPLVLKGKWYRMIESGEKREEYRDATDYWKRRFRNWRHEYFGGKYAVVEFRLGYQRNAPRMAFISGGLFPYQTGCLYPEWGEPEAPHYAIALGERVELEG